MQLIVNFTMSGILQLVLFLEGNWYYKIRSRWAVKYLDESNKEEAEKYLLRNKSLFIIYVSW